MHIVQRGNNRGVCFQTESDHRLYLRLLAKFSGQFAIQVHAFVLMTNHVHLLLTPGEAESAALLMKHVGQCYAQYANQRYGRSGTLWEGRFRSCVVDEDSYLLSCYRYIERNPVRAGLVQHPGQYAWSSYRFNADGVPSRFLVPHACYEQLGSTGAARRAAYRSLFDDTIDLRSVDAIRAATKGNRAVGSEHFLAALESTLGRRARRGIPGRPTRNAG
jgi:putative transposase